MIKNVLFDLDGTLTDPKLGITSCIRYALEKMGHPAPPAEELVWCIGPPLWSSFAMLLQTDNPAQTDQAIACYRERFSTTGLFENELIAGIPDVLHELQQAGARMFVATSKPTFYAEQIIEHFTLTPFFERVFGAEMDGTNSFKPDLLKLLLNETGIEAQDCLMIGDRHHDIEGAKANNIPSAAVTWGYGSDEEFYEAKPDHICEHPSDIIRVVTQSGSYAHVG